MAKLVIQNSKPSIVWINSELIEEKIGGQYYSTEYIQYENILRNNKLVNFGDVICEYNGGPMGFQLHSYDYVAEGIPVLRTKDISELTVEFNDPIFITKEKHEELKNSKTYSGDIIISKTGQIGVVAVVPFNVKEANLNQALCNVRVKEVVIDNYFLAVFLNSKYGQYQFIRQGEGKAVQNGLTKDEILALEIPVISPEIQKYIGDKVRKAEELRAEAKRLKKEAEEIFSQKTDEERLMILLNQSEEQKHNWVKGINIDNSRLDAEYNQKKYTIINEFFVKNGVMMKTVNDFTAEIIVSGSTPKGANYLKQGIPFVRATNLSDYTINDDLVYISNEESQKLKGSEIKDGDIVYSIAGSIGVVSIVPEYIEKANINQALVRLRLKNINNYYFMFVANSNLGRMLSSRQANGAVQLNLNREEVGNILVPILNDNIQATIGNKIERYIQTLKESKKLVQEAKQDVEDLIEGNFDMSKIKEIN